MDSDEAWVRSAERLPPLEHTVLVFNPGAEYFGVRMAMEIDMRVRHADGREDWEGGNRPCWWRELPEEPPEEGQ